jgi:RNA polymerase sigma factor (sigma-70 family)
MRFVTAFMGYLRVGFGLLRYAGPDPALNEVIPRQEMSREPGINPGPRESIPGEESDLGEGWKPGRVDPPGRLAREQRERFDESVLPHLDAAYNLARYLLRDAHEAEEAVQDAFLRAISHFGSFRGADGRAWLLSIVRNTCYTQFRRRRSGGEKIEFDEELHSTDNEISEPEAQFARAVAAQSVREGVDQLPAEFREVIVLRELEDLSYKEIASATGVPIGTVMSRLARGRKQLLIALGLGKNEVD